MEIINFINDLRKMGGQYFDIWLPIIIRFQAEETVIIKVTVPLDVSKSTYHRVINYGLSAFSKHVKTYILTKKYSSLILSRNNFNQLTSLEKQAQPIEIAKIIQDEIIQSEIIQEESVSIEEPTLQNQKPQRKKIEKFIYTDDVYETIIHYLNQSTGKNYKHNSIINRKFITARLNDGFTIDDFKRVIQVKSVNWLGSKMEQFLRPETLFSNKFESYLNENIISNTPNSNLKNTYDQVSIATQYYDS